MADSEVVWRCDCGEEFDSANKLIDHGRTAHGVDVE